MEWTHDYLASKSVEQRNRMWINARKQCDGGSQDACAKARLIEECGLPFQPAGGISHDDPHFIEMVDIIGSTDAERAIRSAIADGLPPMAGVDLLLQRRMGDRYSNANQKTLAAGYETARVARALGYVQTGKKAKLPDECVARSAEVMVKP